MGFRPCRKLNIDALHRMRYPDTMTPGQNIILIGMPGAGKSTVGVLLAKALSCDFVDTDVLIQASEGRRLQAIIDAEGLDEFLALEERHVLALTRHGAVIATGGSVVYSDPAMTHLKRHGRAVYLQLPLPDLEARITDMDSRGVVIAPWQNLADLYHERLPLYEHFADFTIDCAGLSHGQVVQAILRALA